MKKQNKDKHNFTGILISVYFTLHTAVVHIRLNRLVKTSENEPRHMKRHILHIKNDFWKASFQIKSHGSAFSFSDSLYIKTREVLKHNCRTPLQFWEPTIPFLHFLLHANEWLFTLAISMSVKVLIWASFMLALVFAGLSFCDYMKNGSNIY